MLDMRLGKRRLGRLEMSEEHEMVRKFYAFRCKYEGIGTLAQQENAIEVLTHFISSTFENRWKIRYKEIVKSKSGQNKFLNELYHIIADKIREDRIVTKLPFNIFEMAGYVCEWVIPEDSARVARGGHFMSDRDELGIGRHIEDPDKWNMSYPNEPKSIWWFVDAKWLGFRVVCEASSVINQISLN